MKKTLILTLAATAITACATSPTGRSQLMIVSPKSAITESQKAYISTVAELDSAKQLITDPVTVKRISTITGRLVTEAVKAHPDTAKWKWSVAIIDDDKTLNAWCMAGGRMAIYSGIIRQLDLTDDEIAHIMGHEISHALANHTAERMSRAVVMNAGLSAAAKVTENNQYVLTGTALAAKVALELPNSRTAESEADSMGLELAVRAGYSAGAAVTLWQKMEKAAGSSTPQFMSTHPSPKNRAKALQKQGEKMQALNPQQTKAAVYNVAVITKADQVK